MTGVGFLERSPARVFSDWNPQTSLDSLTWLREQDLPHDPARFEQDIHGIWQSLETLLGAGPVTAFDQDFFRIDEAHGTWAVLQPVQQHDTGDLCDVIAWHPRRPERWRFLTGAGEMLGSIWLHVGKPKLRVFATPLDWLRAGGDGVCLLRRERMIVLRHLTLLRVLEVDDPVLAGWLDRVLRDPGPVPKIVVREDVGAAA
jgi:hypothetical protein